MKKTLIYSFKRSIPIMIGFFPLGIAYGILMEDIGYNVLWTGACSTFVLAGSLQFLMISFLKGGIPLITVFLLSLLLNSRHIFYGLSFIEKFRSFDKKSKWFLIFTLTDESYSLHCSYQQQNGVREKAAYVLTAFFVLFYWVIFSVLGAFVGSAISFNTKGIDFSLTALFTVILIDQMRQAKSRIPAFIAGISGIVCLLIFGAENFILPSLFISIAALFVFRKKLESTAEEEQE